MSINAAVGRRGSLFRDRHHRHELATPREVRHALVYLLFNVRKHARGADARTQQEAWASLDPFSSAPWFDHWAHHTRPPPERLAARGLPADSPLARAKTWLARVGWKRGGGPIRVDEAPSASRPRK
jgi:putative transposase